MVQEASRVESSSVQSFAQIRSAPTATPGQSGLVTFSSMVTSTSIFIIIFEPRRTRWPHATKLPPQLFPRICSRVRGLGASRHTELCSHLIRVELTVHHLRAFWMSGGPFVLLHVGSTRRFRCVCTPPDRPPLAPIVPRQFVKRAIPFVVEILQLSRSNGRVKSCKVHRGLRYLGPRTSSPGLKLKKDKFSDNFPYSLCFGALPDFSVILLYATVFHMKGPGTLK